MIHNLSDRLRVEANVTTVKNAITKYGVHLCRLPATVMEALVGKAYLEGEIAEVYYVCSISKFCEVLAYETEAGVANKQSLAELAKYVADGINTAYDVDCVPEMNAIDLKLDQQKIRIVYLPSPSLLAIISLIGKDLNDEQKTSPQETMIDGKKEVTIKISL
jgi:hypothetical protein